MRFSLVVISIFWVFLTLSQQGIESRVQYISYDAFYESDSAMINPVLPALGQPYQVGKHRSWFNKKEQNKGNYFAINPILNTVFNYAKFNTDRADLNMGGGIGFETQLSPKFYVRANFIGNFHFRDGIYEKTTRYFKTDYWNYRIDNIFDISIQPSVRLSYTPYDFINIQAGIDNHFIGSGKRSMLLSDYSAPYPFVQLQTKIWKFEVTNIYQFFDEQMNGKRINKFGSTHFFNFKATDRFNIGVFESVIFAPKDTLMNRGYELAYLNPFLFYRPTEYGLGSQDRLVIGLNTSYQFDNWLIYAQVAFDEFVLKELLKRTRWWANKYSGQLGAKWKGQVNNIQLQWLGEINFARPYVYAHLNASTAYGHKGNPLAHPLSSNFVEIYTEFGILFKNFMVKPHFFFVQQGGFDGGNSINYGNDVYASYADRPFDYGHKIGANGKVNRYHLSVEGSYNFLKKMHVEGFLRTGIELNNRYGENYKPYFFFMGGIRSKLWNNRSFDF